MEEEGTGGMINNLNIFRYIVVLFVNNYRVSLMKDGEEVVSVGGGERNKYGSASSASIILDLKKVFSPSPLRHVTLSVRII